MSDNLETAAQQTCFVIIGYGRKADPLTGRVIDLDKTFRRLIQPACDRVNLNCFRAIDANMTGSIDELMYTWIYKADFVIADLTTLNANVFYELGVRHALRPHTTLVIAESVLIDKLPFDLSSFVVHRYEDSDTLLRVYAPGGDRTAAVIAAAEEEQFVHHLAESLGKVIEEKSRAATRLEQRRPDSPPYIHLRGMTSPGPPEVEYYTEPPPYVPPEERARQPAEEDRSLASLIRAAETARDNKQYPEAVGLFRDAIDWYRRVDKEKPDSFLFQQLALVTYKNGEVAAKDGTVDPARAIGALNQAETILQEECAGIEFDPEIVSAFVRMLREGEARVRVLTTDVASDATPVAVDTRATEPPSPKP